MTDQCPYVVLSCAMSIDGYIDDATDTRLLLSNDADFDRVDNERALSDAIMIGANTIRRDNPRLLIRSESRRAHRKSLGLPSSPAKVTVTFSGKISPESKFFSEGGADVRRIVYCASSSITTARARLGKLPSCNLIDAGDPLDLAGVLTDLAHRGYRRVFVEGGTTILTQLLSHGLADELQIAIAPFFVGGGGAPRFVNDASFPFNSMHRMTLAEVKKLEEVVVLRYVLPKSTDSVGVERQISYDRP